MGTKCRVFHFPIADTTSARTPLRSPRHVFTINTHGGFGSFCWLVHSYEVLLRASSHVARSELDLFVDTNCRSYHDMALSSCGWYCAPLVTDCTRCYDSTISFRLGIHLRRRLLRWPSILLQPIGNTRVTEAANSAWRQGSASVPNRIRRRFTFQNSV